MAWRILIADDDPEICTFIKKILADDAFDVTSCPDAESALVSLRHDEPYDMLISDFMMPGNSGIELIMMVRANRKTASLPVLMITGHGNHAMESRAKMSGAQSFLHKPFSPRQLRAAVDQLLTSAPPAIT